MKRTTCSLWAFHFHFQDQSLLRGRSMPSENLLRLYHSGRQVNNIYISVEINPTQHNTMMTEAPTTTIISPVSTKSPPQNGASSASVLKSFNELPPLPLEYADGTFQTVEPRNMARPLEEFSERTHDQLPAVMESHKTNVALSTFDTTRRTQRRKMLLLIAGMFVLASVCVTLGVVIGRDEEEASETTNGGTNNVAVPDTDSLPDEIFYVPRSPAAAPSTTTTDRQNPNATLTTGRTPSRLENVKAFVSTNQWSTLESTLDPESPQSKASLWLADFDPLFVELEDTMEVRNRYALAVLYYAFDGPRWAHDVNWMTVFDTCDWNDMWATISGTTPVTVGVVCDGTTIHRILLPSMGLKGRIPPEIALLSGLAVFDVYGNDLEGTIPAEMEKLSSLTDLILHENSFMGTFPSWISSMTNLEHIDFARNSFYGAIPSTLGQLPRLQSLNLENNQFNGTLDRFTDCRAMQYLRLGNNQISGELTSDVLMSWAIIEELDVSTNQLAGNLPDILFDLASLRVIDLHDNQFAGNIPTAVSTESTLKFLSLSQNRLTGPIATSLSYLSNLHHLDLSMNALDGTIPVELENLYLLKYLFLAFNPKLTPGPIPKSWDSFSELEDLSLQGTNRNGTIPGELGLLNKLVMLDLADNQLTGAIPDDLGTLSNLKFLFLKKNQLVGEIPTTFGQLSKLNTVVLDHNNFSGGSTHVCSVNTANTLEVFVSDCEEMQCDRSCCTQCCGSTNDELNDVSCNYEWFSRKFHDYYFQVLTLPIIVTYIILFSFSSFPAAVDPVAAYEYQRISYKFHENDLVFPVSEEGDRVADNYDKYGIPGGI